MIITKKVVEIDDEEMGKLLKKNFENYANKMSLGTDEPEEEVEDKIETPATDAKKFDMAIYETLKVENGKSQASIFFSLLCKVFDEEEKKVRNYFLGYLEQLISQKKMQNKDFSEGISKFIQFMPEIVLDLP